MSQQPTTLKELQDQYPREAQLLSSLATAAAKDIENQLGDLPGEEKKKLAEKQTIDLLRRVYDGSDMFFNFHPAIDMLTKECLIPLIPDLLDAIVGLFNSIVHFDKNAGGTQ